MTSTQLAAVVEALRRGATLSQASKAAGVPLADLQAAARDDDDIAELLEECARPAAAPAVAKPARTRGKRKKGDEEEPLDLDAIDLEAAEYGGGAFGYLMWLDARLQAGGFPGMSPWWRSQVRAFYESGKRWAIFMCGRGAGKSTSLVRIAACEALFTPRVVPPGQRWVWPFISVATSDARRRIVEMQAIYAALGIGLTPKYPNGHPTLELTDVRGNAIGFVSIASTIAGVSGPSTIGATIDEEAKLRDKASGANPSTEILASLLQTFRARPGIRAIRCSSAWGTSGSHWAAIAEGDTSQNYVGRIGAEFIDVVTSGLYEVAQREAAQGDAAGAQAIRDHAASITAESTAIPTWLANPTISALACREEVDAMPAESLGGLTRAAYWLRENASVPMMVDERASVARVSHAGLADRVRELNARIGQDRDARLVQFGGLSSLDPRSTSYRGSASLRARRRVM